MVGGHRQKYSSPNGHKDFEHFFVLKVGEINKFRDDSWD
jgi:hypothetical protein